jgi:hypothetical protein
MNEKFRSWIVALVTAIVTATLIFASTYALYLYFKELLLGIIGVLTGVGLVLLVNSYYRSKIEIGYELAELDRFKTGETHPLFYYRVEKNIVIHNKEGNATVDYHMECKNTSSRSLPQVKHEINYDGDMKKFSATIDGEDFTASVKKELFFRQKIEGEQKISVKQPYTLKIWFDLREEKIKSNYDFEYGYAFANDGLYPDMDKKGCEFSGVHINHPTELLIFRIELAESLQFVEEGIAMQVVDKHDVEDSLEMEKCLKLHPWFMSRNKRRISWEITKPKIASTYKLYFQTSAKHKTDHVSENSK